jgi:hypothetical protein
MGYDKNKIFKDAKKLIVEKRLFFIEDIIVFLPISKPTFYDYYPIGSDEINELKELLEKNKVTLKVSMRSTWFKSSTPALQMALYKIIASKEERRALSMNGNQEYEDEQEKPTEMIITHNHVIMKRDEPSKEADKDNTGEVE